MAESLTLPQVFIHQTSITLGELSHCMYVLLDKLPLHLTQFYFFKTTNHHQIISDNNMHSAMDNFLYGIKYAWSYKGKTSEVGG